MVTKEMKTTKLMVLTS